MTCRSSTSTGRRSTRLPDVVWPALRSYVDRLLAASSGGLFTRLLGAQPAAGFEVSEEVLDERLVLTGRHRFSRYRLVFELEAGWGSEPSSRR